MVTWSFLPFAFHVYAMLNLSILGDPRPDSGWGGGVGGGGRSVWKTYRRRKVGKKNLLLFAISSRPFQIFFPRPLLSGLGFRG